MECVEKLVKKIAVQKQDEGGFNDASAQSIRSKRIQSSGRAGSCRSGARIQTTRSHDQIGRRSRVRTGTVVASHRAGERVKGSRSDTSGVSGGLEYAGPPNRHAFIPGPDWNGQDSFGRSRRRSPFWESKCL